MRKRGAQAIPSPTSSIILLVVLAGFLLFVLSIPDTDRQELITNNQVAIDEIVLLSKTNLDFDGYHGLTKDVLTFSDLTLDGSAKFEKTEIASNIALTSNLFKTSNFEFVFSPNYGSDTLGHQVTFDVDSVTGYGKIKVYLNGVELGSFEPTNSQTINLDLPTSILIQGVNQLKISGKYVGLNPFNILKLSLTNLAIIEKKEGIELEKTIMFYMPESRSTDSAKADLFVRNLGTSMLSPILIQLNSKEIFKITSVGAVSFPLPNTNIQAGINKLSFNVNKGSAFEILFPKITTYTARESAVKSYQFSIDKTEARLVTDGRAKCNLLLISADEDVTLDLVINGYSKSIFIGGSIYEEDICDDLVYGTNRVYMSSDESFDLDEITIKLY